MSKGCPLVGASQHSSEKRGVANVTSEIPFGHRRPLQEDNLTE